MCLEQNQLGTPASPGESSISAPTAPWPEMEPTSQLGFGPFQGYCCLADLFTTP